MVVLFSWVVLHVPIKSYNLVNKAQIEVWLGSLAFHQQKNYSYCSSLLFSSCSLAILDSSSFNNDPSTRNNHRQHTKQIIGTTKNNTPNKRKALKERTKG